MIANNEETHIVQRSFRSVLNAFARPGTVESVEALVKPESPLSPYWETLVRMFVDQAVTFNVANGARTDAAEWITLQTHAKSECPDQADFVLALGAEGEDQAKNVLAHAKAGTLLEPELGATVVLNCAYVGAVPEEENQHGLYLVKVAGPGVKDTASFAVSNAEWVSARAERADEYPCGIDLILLGENGNVVAIPRTTKIRVVHGMEGVAVWGM